MKNTNKRLHPKELARRLKLNSLEKKEEWNKTKEGKRQSKKYD